jgi:phosphohistidine phosphatase SixA
MRLIFLRHGIAEDKGPEDTDLDDFKRVLLREGVKETKSIIKGLKKEFKNTAIVFSSPFLRAMETAELLHKKIPHAKLEMLMTLDPAHKVDEFLESISSLADGTYCFVGHEPHLSKCLSSLIGREAKIKLEKSGVAILEGKNLGDLALSLLVSPKFVD